MLTAPVYALLAGLQLAAGALMAVTFHPLQLVIGPSIMGSLFACMFGASSKLPSLSGGKLWTYLPAVSLLLLPALGYLYAQAHVPTTKSDDVFVLSGKSMRIQARIESVLPQRGGRHNRYLITALRAGRDELDKKVSGAAILFLSSKSEVCRQLRAGVVIDCRCSVVSTADLRKRGKAGYADYLKRQGVFTFCYLNSHSQVEISSESETAGASNNPLARFAEGIEHIRCKLLSEHIHNLGPRQGGLLSAMVLGEKAVGLDSELLSSFRTVGLSHVLAASGFNLTVVTVATYFACRNLLMPSFVSNVFCFFMMVVFVLFAGTSASVMRASIMCALAIACHCLSRRVHLGGVLGVALIISVITQPLSLADPGFQLSYSAVGGIIFIAAPVALYLEKAISSRWIRWPVDCVVTVLIAQSCVLPLQLFYFKQLGLLFLPANFIASIVVTPVTVLGFISSIIVICWELFVPSFTLFGNVVAILDWLASFPLNILISTVNYLASFTWALVTFPPISLAHVVAYYFLFAWLSYFCVRKLEEKSKLQNLDAADSLE